MEPPFQQYTSLLGSRYFVHTLYFHDPRLSYRCDDALSLSFHLLDALSSRLTGNKEQLQLILMQLVQSIYNMPKKTSRLTYLIMHYFVRVFSDNVSEVHLQIIEDSLAIVKLSQCNLQAQRSLTIEYS